MLASDGPPLEHEAFVRDYGLDRFPYVLSTELGLAPVASRPLGWIDGVTIAGGVAILAATYGSINQLIANAPELARLRERA